MNGRESLFKRLFSRDPDESAAAITGIFMAPSVLAERITGRAERWLLAGTAPVTEDRKAAQ